jgi:tetratricopeptide (TPR) repeat protein
MPRVARFFASCLLAVTMLWPEVSAAAPPAKRLERGIELYYAGKLDEALAIFDRLAIAKNTPRRIRVAALVHKAFVLYLFKLHDEARQVWQQVLELDPTFALDPVEVSPELMSFFGPPGPGRQPAPAVSVDPSEPSAAPDRGCGVALCLVPFGVGQFANDRPLKGALFAGAETLLLAANVGFYWAARSESERDGGSRSTAETYYLVQRVSFGLFAATAAWGILDAFLLP